MKNKTMFLWEQEKKHPLDFYMEQINQNEKYGYGISFIDIDETTFHTFAQIYVMKDGEVVRKLNNQEFNTYKLQEGESYDFREFRDAKTFKENSTPIEKTIFRIKKMLSRIKESGSKSKIIFLTARADFNNKEEFLSTFEKYGIDMNTAHVYVERTGNMKSGSVAERKQQTILKYLRTGIYRRCRMLDDDDHNLEIFKNIANTLPEDIKQTVRQQYNLSSDEEPIKFYALKVDKDGNLTEV